MICDSYLRKKKKTCTKKIKKAQETARNSEISSLASR